MDSSSDYNLIRCHGRNCRVQVPACRVVCSDHEQTLSPEARALLRVLRRNAGTRVARLRVRRALVDAITTSTPAANRKSR